MLAQQARYWLSHLPFSSVASLGSHFMWSLCLWCPLLFLLMFLIWLRLWMPIKDAHCSAWNWHRSNLSLKCCLYHGQTSSIVYRFWPSLLAVCGMSPAHGHHHLCFINKETRFREVATGDFSGCYIQQVGHSLISDSKYQVLCVPPLSSVGSLGSYQGVPIILPPLLHSPIRGVLGKQAWFLSGQRMISGPSSLFYVLRGNSLWLSQGAMVLGTVIKGGYCACLSSWSCNSVLAVDAREFYVTNLMSFSRTSKGF